MLFKLSLKNINKSFKDYAIYFVTLILGVAIFYVFNSLDSQQAMKAVSASTYQVMDVTIQLLSGMSVFVSFILGFLIVYANNFLIKRRKKEFGIYLSLGMGKMQVSRILLGETFLIGLISLGLGLVLGVFGAQFMSLVVVKMFNGIMDGYQFVFSKAAFIKTIVYFSIMFAIVAVFNVVTISRCRLIKLLSARKENETVKMKNPWICFFVFLIAIADLGIQYYLVCHPQDIEPTWIPGIIAAGSIGTFLFFWSLSGFLLNIMQHKKNLYLRDLNAFVLRQIHSKINTTVFAMTIICLMLFLTISVLAGGLGMNHNLQKSLDETTPVDLNLYMDSENQKTVLERLKENEFDTAKLQDDLVEFPIYCTEELMIRDTMDREEMEANLVVLPLNKEEEIVKLSDYNKLAALYGFEKLDVPPNSYAIVADHENVVKLRDKMLKNGMTITLNKTTFKPAYSVCQYGFMVMMANHGSDGFFVLPDEQVNEEWRAREFLAANYSVSSPEEVEELEKEIADLFEKEIYANTKTDIISASVGLSAMVTFLATYLGIVFLISSAAILALKELSDSSDNKERYEMLRKIGADEKMLNRALLRQMSIFFFIPLLLAIVHSVFGITFIGKMLDSLGQMGSFGSILVTAGILVAVYGGYFLITYSGSKRIIQNK